ncbi:hypothetical protein [Streptomyces sp. NPDC057682]|uniref:hypothetical protein n=1 Tax=unclassified Streptomyces TaxID=2593676 RepID=UPI003667F5D1
MGKKQSRQNRGARTGGHAYGAPSESKDQKSTDQASDPAKAISEQVSHKRERKFGHN